MARIHGEGDHWPNGSITISDRKTGTVCCQGRIRKDPPSNDGLATIKKSDLAAGSYILVAVYGGDDEGKYYNGAQSNMVSLTVKAKPGGPRPRSSLTTIREPALSEMADSTVKEKPSTNSALRR
jgi:hypothetical protein